MEGELSVDEAARGLWEGWLRRYRRAEGALAPGLLLDLGREMFGWLDTGGWGAA